MKVRFLSGAKLHDSGSSTAVLVPRYLLGWIAFEIQIDYGMPERTRDYIGDTTDTTNDSRGLNHTRRNGCMHLHSPTKCLLYTPFTARMKRSDQILTYIIAKITRNWNGDFTKLLLNFQLIQLRMCSIFDSTFVGSFPGFLGLFICRIYCIL